MLTKLQQIFPNLVLDSQIPTSKYNEYEWYQNDDLEVLGIPREEITEKEVHLLSTFLTPYHHFFPEVTEQEKKWESRIQMNTEEKIVHPFRFVFFSIQQKQIDPKTFKEAINELFHKEVSILWENDYEGIIIEEKTTIDEDISYEQIIDILISDLYVNLKVFVGPYQYDLNNIKHHYENILHSAKVAFQFTDKIVLSYIDAIPLLIMDKLGTSFKEELKNSILKHYKNDSEFLQTIEIFIESNLNISVAAKKMYMHRNSLQYRLDKFQEHTGIDIRDFQQAMTVYFALIANK
ncbi:PucR family transcriptional regulator [Ornithinibacillus halophilus]|uniref:PucR C-terminal helix-turn-helix domain-containing protein n=1 Tax=Ornithinibacillus halophilus TaxID=930117 RepID=A0A1M5NIK0_9BACI|nr:helix-turn-helix domain-containing protein [Ornithinibacillus halophilus]SHG89348.1 PucR C-terminal helix-turn-helix domain-containing protein [Ornithinibacillus halophilus]